MINRSGQALRCDKVPCLAIGSPRSIAIAACDDTGAETFTIEQKLRDRDNLDWNKTGIRNIGDNQTLVSESTGTKRYEVKGVYKQ